MTRRAFPLIWSILIPAAAAVGVDEQVQRAEHERIAAIQRAGEAVIAIFSSDGSGGGSGVIITPDGFALSNFHVTKPSGDWMKVGLPDGSYEDAVIVGLDPTGDVALIKLLGREKYPSARLGDSDTCQVGEAVFAMGNPFLLATDFRPTVTFGIISGMHRYQYPAGTILEYADCLQIDASINPGNSGGPLFNLRGELIGINGRGSFEKRGRVNVGVAYAISINQIKNFLGSLEGGRVVDHASLGAVLDTDGQGRVIVSDILEESDAYRRGLRYGDEITSFAGRPIRTVNAFKNALGIYPKGWRMPLELRRRGKTEQIFVRLPGVHTEAELRQAVAGAETPDPNKPRDPQPAPEPAPKEDRDQPDQQDKPRIPSLPRISQPPRQQAMPEIVRRHFEPRDGYVNYYFNKLKQQEILKALASDGDFSALQGPWLLKGELLTHGDVEFELNDKSVRAILPGGPIRLDITDDLSDARDPVDSGGLLAGLAIWRRFLTAGVNGFDELFYLGTAPLAGTDALTDVLVTRGSGVESHFYFDRQSSRLLAMEIYPGGTSEDPCELYFRSVQMTDGRALPGEIEVRFGDDLYGVLQLTEFKFLPSDQR